MDEYVANKISKLIQLQCDINLLEFQLENPGIPHPTPYYEPIRIISKKIKRLQDRIEELCDAKQGKNIHNKSNDMKTELAELNQESLMRKLGDECFFKMKEINPSGGIKEFIRIAVEFGYKKSQSNPKIKQLEWDFCGLYYDVKTAVGHYMILQGDEQYLENHNTCTLTHNGNLMAEFDSIDEAMSAAQADFEKRIKECLE